MFRAGRWTIAFALTVATIGAGAADDAALPETRADAPPSFLNLGESLTPAVISGADLAPEPATPPGTADLAPPATTTTDDAAALATAPEPIAQPSAPETTSALPSAPPVRTPSSGVREQPEVFQPDSTAPKRKATAAPAIRTARQPVRADKRKPTSGRRQTPTGLIANGLDSSGGNIANIGSPDAATDLGFGN